MEDGMVKESIGKTIACATRTHGVNLSDSMKQHHIIGVAVILQKLIIVNTRNVY
jgi:hypothetical protein